MRALINLVLFLSFTISTSLIANDELLKNKMINDLDIIKNSFEVKYAPAEWKKTYANWDLEEQIDIAKTSVRSFKNITVTDYQHILRTFFNSTKDYHVNVMFHSTAAAFLPFRVQNAEGRYFIAWVDSINTSLPIKIGDELVEFDDRPVADVIEELKRREQGNYNSLTDQACADILLTERIGALGHQVPQGVNRIGIKHFGTKNIVKYNIEWNYIPEEINNDKIYNQYQAHSAAKIKAVSPNSSPLKGNPLFHKQMIAPFYPAIKEVLNNYHTSYKLNEDDSDDNPIGRKKSFVPDLGQIIWQASPEIGFHAYIYKTPKQKRVGYIRIPDYQGGSSGTLFAAEEFLSIITQFQDETDALVVDQLNNPGGEVFYMYALASMLTDQPLALPTHRETITQQDVYYALKTLPTLKNYIFDETSFDTISGYPITPELVDSITKQLQFTIDEWNAGHTFTSPGYLYGVKKIKPHPTAHYNKPILFLVNEMAFSCGDFLPAILQDNKRATIFGTQTAGAGGYVLGQTHSNLFGIEGYSLTGSLAERIDKTPIENLGVTPDIIYHITAADLQNNYSGYTTAVNKALENLLKNK